MLCLFFDFRFVDQHHRDVVANRVHALTLYALQTTLIRLQLYGRLTQGTHQDVQQILADWHGSIQFNRWWVVGGGRWESAGVDGSRSHPTTHHLPPTTLEGKSHLQFEPPVIAVFREGSEAARQLV